MLASSFFDPVIGVDVHFEMVPTPAPVPTPIPNPFTGMVFDPMGLAFGLALGAAVAAVTGAPITGPVLYWGAMPATNTGTEAKHIPGHILIPPGTAWAPFPKTPKPVVHPGETPTPALPIKPENDAVVITGSKTVHAMGSNAVRLGDIALSCSEPLRLPSSVVLAVPKGRLILIGGPPSLDIMAAVLASLRTRFVSDSLHALISRLRPSRFRNLLHRAVCFLTGHPVDVASGKVLTDAVDVRLPGPLGLTVERVYSSAFADRDGPLGHGWAWSLDQAVWRERGKVVVLCEDGREIEFDTFDFPDHRIEAGQGVYNPIERLTLHCDADGVWRVVEPDGVTRWYAPVAGRSDGRAMIHAIRSRDAHHETRFFYDAQGRLNWVRDAGGRTVGIVHGSNGRVTELHLPTPDGNGHYCHRSYSYDEHGDLVQVTDARGHHWRFAYVTHLLTQETDRSGLSFYFAYDGVGEDAWCIRTWGDAGLYDHVLAYDKPGKTTIVTDSRGFSTTYRMNVGGLVTEIVDPLGGVRRFEYDPRTLQRTAEVDELGNTTRYAYDERGNRVEVQNPDGTVVRSRYHERENLCVETVDARGGTWTWTYDSEAHVREQQNPLGHVTRFAWAAGLLESITHTDGSVIKFAYDGAKNLGQVTGPSGARVRVEHDGLGRPWRTWLPSHAIEERRYDPESNVVLVAAPHRVQRRFTYDAEANMTSATDGVRSIELRYAGYHRLVERREGPRVERFEFDSEDRLVAMINEAGERATLELDARGLPIAEHSFDGRTLRYERDALGRVERVHSPSGRSSTMVYDAGGRVIEVDYSDGVVHRFAYSPDDMLIEASNEVGVVNFERDALGRLLRESFSRHGETPTWVESRYGLGGARESIVTSRGARQRIERDAAGHPTLLEVEDELRWSVRFDRDERGWETARTHEGQVYEHLQRDPSGRPIERHLHANHDLFWSQQIDWRGDDRVAAIIDTENGPREFEHDRAGRLLGWHRPDEPGELRFYDESGRVFRSPDRSDRDYGPGGRLERAGDASFEYDEDGHRIARNDSDGHQRFHFDDRGWLREVETVDGRRIGFEYDVFGRRVAKQVVAADGTPSERTEWIWDGEQVIHELCRDRAPITWIHEPERWAPIAKLEGREARSIINGLSGAPTELFDLEGRRQWRMQLDAFGEPTIEGRADECPWRWPGQYADEETGLYYNRHRYYDPKTGLYLSPDPLGLAAGSRIWSYVDDPLTWIDPLGLCDFIALFRGTSQGYPGNPGVQLARRTPTSTNPAIATIFATQSHQHGDGVLHILTHSDLTGIRTGPGNVLAHLEAEVVVHALPRQVRNRATVTITADAARQILGDMGIHVPAVIRDVATLDRAVRNAPHMSNNQIRRFLQRAEEQNTNPKCFR